MSIIGGLLALASCQSPAPPASRAGAVEIAAAKVDPNAPTLVVETGVHAAPVRRIAVQPRTGVVVTTSDDKSARLWRLDNGALKQVFRPQVSYGRRGALYGAAAHPTEDLVAVAGSTGDETGGHRIMLIDGSTGVLRSDFDAIAGDVRNLVWSSDGSLLFAVYAGGNGLRAFDRQGRLRFDERFAQPSFALSSAAGLVVAGATDGDVIVLAAAQEKVSVKGRYQRRGKRLISLELSPDAANLAIVYDQHDTPPEIVSTLDGRLVRALKLPPIRPGGALNALAWSPDATMLYASGRGSERDGEFSIYRYDVATGALAAKTPVATDSVLELRTLPDGRVVYGSFDGSWGIIAADAIALKVEATVSDFRGPENLTISPNARAVRWSPDGGKHFIAFDFDRRILWMRDKALPGALAPSTGSSLFSSARWRYERKPFINGASIPMAANESSMSLSYLRVATDEAILGTRKRLLRIDANGKVRWQVFTPGDVRAVNVSEDDQFIVTGLSDGTLRWWQAVDGAPVLTLLAARDGRWVVWTPDGHFDASAGADRMVGWAVNREKVAAADFFSLSKLRERFNKPEVIDRVIGVPRVRSAALNAASAESSSAGGKSGGSSRIGEGVSGLPAGVAGPRPTVPIPGVGAVPSQATRPPVAADFPPILRSTQPPSLADDGILLRIPFAWRASSDATDIQIRINGRPASDSKVISGAAGAAPFERAAIAEVALPEKAALIQVIVKDANGFSEPLSFQYPGRGSASASSRPTRPSAMAGTAPAGSPAGTGSPPAAQSSQAIGRPGTAGAEGLPTQAALVTQVSTTAEIAVAASIASAAPPSPATSTTEGAPAGPTQRLFVLAIGVSNYQRPEYSLGLAAKDATDFSNVMRGQRGRLYRDVEIRTLTNFQASRQKVIENLAWLGNAVGPDDIAMLFIAGHGINAEDGTYYFLPFDADATRLMQTSVPEIELRKTLARARGRMLFFVDTCFGGAALSRAGSSELARLANDLSAAENGVIVFASSSGRQESLENDAWGNGAFTKALIAGLRGGADPRRSGRITFKGLDYYISDEVSRLTEGKQTPVTISPTGVPDFAVARL